MRYVKFGFTILHLSSVLNYIFKLHLQFNFIFAFMLHKTILSVGLLFVFSCSSQKHEEKGGVKKQPPALVDVVVAGTQPVQHSIEVNGSILANETLEIHPEVSGRLTYLNVPDGGKVAAGQVLARINDAELNAQLSKSKVQLALATKTEKRLHQLIEMNGINQADYDIALNNVNNIKADIELIQAQLSKTIVRAPFSGVLGLRMTSPGAYVTPTTVLATLQQVNQVKVDFSLPDLYATSVKKGSIVNIITNQDELHNAIITAIEPEINTSTRNIKVRALLKGGVLQPGSFVKVKIDLSDATEKIIMPTNAIIPDADSKKLIVVKEGKGVFTKVETGMRNAAGIEILSGLNIGDSVVVTGVLFVKPNSAVKIKSVKNIEELINTQ